CYRPIRMAASPIGPDRYQVCYKSAAEDPMTGVDGSRATPATWASAPTSWPESELVGSTYQGVQALADLVVTDASSWLWAGTSLADGQRLAKVVTGEYDRYDASRPGPHNVQVLAHSPVVNRGPGRYSDVTWYTVPGGGGVFASGTASWVNLLSASAGVPSNVLPSSVPGVTGVLRRAMENLYGLLGSGPAGALRPSVPVPPPPVPPPSVPPPPVPAPPVPAPPASSSATA
ncbi:MAG TPA: N,N-dimethylformamidase beta subunit family domain-containing protein, partial [Acidimicrobiales bacterium]|nr:N,N-dimethylformamidase beta subunit family domain-containing protein [Acidimicrobiales bacterium]